MALGDDVVRLALGRNPATVVTLMPDGQPQALPTWVDTDGRHILVNTEPQRQRVRNIARDPRITVLICSLDDPYDWVEVRGRVVEIVGGDDARRHIHDLHRRYEGIALDHRAIGREGRVILRIEPDRVNTPDRVPRHPPRSRSGRGRDDASPHGRGRRTASQTAPGDTTGNRPTAATPPSATGEGRR